MVSQFFSLLLTSNKLSILKIRITPYIYILLSCLVLQNSYAQESNNYSLKVISLDSIENKILHKIKPQKKLNSAKETTAEINRIILHLKKEGFYTITTDSITLEKNVYKAYLSLGIKITTAVVKLPYDYASSLTTSFYEIKDGTIITTIKQLPILLEQLSSQIAKQGSVFSKVKLQNTQVKKNTLYADLYIEESIKRHIDSIIVKGYENFPKNYLTHFYKIDKKSGFNKSQLITLSKQTYSLKFATELKPPEILFSKDSTLVFLYLKKKKANSFDGLVNFSSNEENKGITLKGYLDLNLINTFNTGEEFSIHWKNTGKSRQFFKINTKLPYLFNTKAITDATFSIYKHDSTFLNISSALKLAIPLNNKTTISARYDFKDSKDLQNDNNSQNVSEFNSRFIGAQIDYETFAQNQFNIAFQTSFGKRKTTSGNTSQYRIVFNSSILLKIKKRFELFLRNSSGYLNSKNYLVNELFRIGGPNSIRGFDQQSIFTSAYTFFNSEFRFTTLGKSTIYSVFDFGAIKDLNTNQNLYSLGLGYAFKTNYNSLDISYIANKSTEMPFSFNTSKITIKILTFF